MKISKWQLINSEYALNSKWIKILKNSYKTSSGRVIPDYYIQEGDDSALIFCVTKDDYVLLERQYRPGINRESLDLPGGRIEEDDTSTISGIIRELEEETGYRAETLEFIGKLAKNPAASNSYVHVFLGKNAIRVSEPKLDETEEIELDIVPLDQIQRLIDEGRIDCVFCVSAISLAKRKLEI